MKVKKFAAGVIGKCELVRKKVESLMERKVNSFPSIRAGTLRSREKHSSNYFFKAL
jgi:hypothetical protein